MNHSFSYGLLSGYSGPYHPSNIVLLNNECEQHYEFFHVDEAIKRISRRALLVPGIQTSDDVCWLWMASIPVGVFSEVLIAFPQTRSGMPHLVRSVSVFTKHTSQEKANEICGMLAEEMSKLRQELVHV